MSDLHLYDLPNLLHLLIVQVLLHDQRLIAPAVDVAIPVLVLEPAGGGQGALHYEDGSGPLAHPLVLDSGDLAGFSKLSEYYTGQFTPARMCRPSWQ